MLTVYADIVCSFLQVPNVPREAVDQLLQLSHRLKQTNDPTVSPSACCTGLPNFCNWNTIKGFSNSLNNYSWPYAQLYLNRNTSLTNRYVYGWLLICIKYILWCLAVDKISMSASFGFVCSCVYSSFCISMQSQSLASSLSTRQLLRICRRISQYPDENIAHAVNKACLSR